MKEVFIKLNKHWRWVLLFVVVVVVMIVGFFVWSSRSPKISYVTTIATKGVLEKTIDVTGEVRSVEEVVLSFDTSGTVKDVLVEKGQAIEGGSVLVTLDSIEAEAAVLRAEQNVRIAEANLAEKRAGASGETIVVSETQVYVADANLESSKTALSNSLDDAEKIKKLMALRVEEAKNVVTSAKASQETLLKVHQQKLNSAWQDIVSSLRSEVIVLREVLSDADRVLGIENNALNDDFENILSVNNSQALILAENAYREAKMWREKTENSTFALSLSANPETINDNIKMVEVYVSYVEKTLLETRRVIEATPAGSADFTVSDLLALKTIVDTARTTLQIEDQKRISVFQIKEELIVGQAKELSTANRLITDSSTSLNSVIAEEARTNNTSEATIATNRALVNVRTQELASAKANLSKTEASPRSVEVSSLLADVERARTDVVSAKSRLDATKLIAPISGVISRVDIKNGELATAGKNIVTIQTTEENFEIAVDVPEADITSVKIGAETSVTFDAFRDSVPVPAVVKTVDPAEKNIEGVIYYEVILDAPTWPALLKPGLSAEAIIVSARRDQVVKIPERAVLTNQTGERYVRILTEEDKVNERTVTLGLRGDAGLVEVIGLNEGEVVIISVRTE